MSDMTELLTLSFSEISKITAQRDEAIQMLAAWCFAVKHRGTDWDDWDEYYKDAEHRDCLNRELIDKAIAALEQEEQQRIQQRMEEKRKWEEK